MRRLLTVLALPLCLLLLAPAAPVQAASRTIADPAGDAAVPRLDMTDILFRNRDHALVFDISFVRVGGGFLLIEFKDRAGHLAAISAHHRPQRGDVNRFGTRREGVLHCSGLRVTWDHQQDTAHVRLPSRCYRDGAFRAISTRYFTEVGVDNDFAPEGNNEARWRWSRWVARG